MLQRKFRLPSSVRFARAQTFATPYFVAKIVSNAQPLSRFGFIVSKKVDKRAVVRNRIKRQIRSGVEQLLPEIQPGYDVLFILRQGAIGQETAVLVEEVKKTLISKGLVVTKNKV